MLRFEPRTFQERLEEVERRIRRYKIVLYSVLAIGIVFWLILALSWLL